MTRTADKQIFNRISPESTKSDACPPPPPSPPQQQQVNYRLYNTVQYSYTIQEALTLPFGPNPDRSQVTSLLPHLPPQPI
jgi:hypothetical protein